MTWWPSDVTFNHLPFRPGANSGSGLRKKKVLQARRKKQNLTGMIDYHEAKIIVKPSFM